MKSVKSLCIFSFILIQTHIFAFPNKEKDDAEFLYQRIIEFLKEHDRDTSIEEFDKICTNVIKEEIPKSHFLKQDKFDKASQGNMFYGEDIKS